MYLIINHFSFIVGCISFTFCPISSTFNRLTGTENVAQPGATTCHAPWPTHRPLIPLMPTVSAQQFAGQQLLTTGTLTQRQR